MCIPIIETVAYLNYFVIFFSFYIDNSNFTLEPIKIYSLTLVFWGNNLLCEKEQEFIFVEL